MVFKCQIFFEDNETMLQNKLDDAHKEIRKMKEENDHLTSARSEIENEKVKLSY